MKARLLIPLLLAAAVPGAHAAPVLIATGELTATAAGPNVDLSGLSGTLENGLPANVLGGMGSGLAYMGNNTFLALPDRGPNATPYNSAVDDTVSYIARFHTMSLALTPSAPGSALPYSLTPVMTSTTLLSSPTPLNYGTGVGLGNKKDGTPLGAGDALLQNTANQFFFTGRSDNFDPTKNSGNPANARLDPESIRVSNDKKSVFISDEYGPYVYQFDRATGQRINTFTLPSDPSLAGNLDVTKLSPQGKVETSTNTSGRTDNKGMEGLAITPDGKTLVGIMQAALIQDAAKATKNLLRIVTIDIATGVTHEYGYLLTKGTGVSDILAINNHEFLVDERDGTGLGDAPGEAALVKQVFKIDIDGATDITNMTAADVLDPSKGVKLVTKSASPVLDVVTALNDAGIASTDIPSKIEGLAFGDDIEVNGELEHTLWVANDNDFTPDSSGPSRWFVFALTDEDLGAALEQQAFIPEPATLALLLPGLAALLRRRARRQSAV